MQKADRHGFSDGLFDVVLTEIRHAAALVFGYNSSFH